MVFRSLPLTVSILGFWLSFKRLGHWLTLPIRSMILFPWSPIGAKSLTFLVKLQDLKSAEKVITEELMANRFVFAGRIIESRDGNPFPAMAPTRAWQESLLSFSWLRHLMFGSQSDQVNKALDLVRLWLTTDRNFFRGSDGPRVKAQRMEALAVHGEALIAQAPANLKRLICQRIVSEIKSLHSLSLQTSGLDRLRCQIALSLVTLTIEEAEWLKSRMLRSTCHHLNQLVIRPGGPVDRCPATLLDLSLGLLLLSRGLQMQRAPIPKSIEEALNLCVSLLAMVKLGDGSMALFNGNGPTDFEDQSLIANHEMIRNQPPAESKAWGFTRLTGGLLQLIMDVGSCPPIAHATKVHASTLAFEVSSGQKRLIMNCGSPRFDEDKWVNVVKQTAAHSGLTIEAESSATVVGPLRALDQQTTLIKGPSRILCEHLAHDEGPMLRTSHNGYDPDFGITHERRVQILDQGTVLRGQDLLHQTRVSAYRNPSFQIRFHLPPESRSNQSSDGHSIFIDLGDGEIWEFTCSITSFSIKESVAVGRIQTMVATQQIEIEGKAFDHPRVIWSFRQHSLPA